MKCFVGNIQHRGGAGCSNNSRERGLPALPLQHHKIRAQKLQMLEFASQSMHTTAGCHSYCLEPGISSPHVWPVWRPPGSYVSQSALNLAASACNAQGYTAFTIRQGLFEQCEAPLHGLVAKALAGPSARLFIPPQSEIKLLLHIRREHPIILRTTKSPFYLLPFALNPFSPDPEMCCTGPISTLHIADARTDWTFLSFGVQKLALQKSPKKRASPNPVSPPCQALMRPLAPKVILHWGIIPQTLIREP